MPTRCAHTPCSFLLRRPKRNIRTAMNHEIMMYGGYHVLEPWSHRPCPHKTITDRALLSRSAIAQKEQLGFDKAVEECKYRM